MLESTTLLISDDPSLIGEVVDAAGGDARSRLAVLPGVDEALARQSWDGVDLVIIHLRRRGPAPKAERLLRSIAEGRRQVAMLVIAEQGEADQELALLRLGVAEYLESPFDKDRLSHLMDVLTCRGRPPERAAAPTRRPPGPDPSIPEEELSEEDRLMSRVRRVAPLDATILITGEEGTGKSRMASTIHDLSGRRSGPFLEVDCAVIPAGRIEGELFGCDPRVPAAPGRDSSGAFARVGGGTLYLGNVDALPIGVQAQLLRVLEGRVFKPAGSPRAEEVQARVIAASGRPLTEAVAAHRFRSDLFYRLNVIDLSMPPLREGRSRIPTLVEMFIAEAAETTTREVDSISADALHALQGYDWPGNIRELRSVIERAVSLPGGRQIALGDLPDSVRFGSRSPSQRVALPAGRAERAASGPFEREAEVDRISQALGRNNNNKLRAARDLGISRMTLYKRLYKYGLMVHEGPATA